MSLRSLRVYVAAPFELQAEARLVAGTLEQCGIGTTSRWLTTGDADSDAWARRCEADVTRCDVFLALNPREFARSGTGGRHVELGMARILRKPIVVFGARTNLFHQFADIRFVDHAPDLIPAVLSAAADHGLLEDIE